MVARGRIVIQINKYQRVSSVESTLEKIAPWFNHEEKKFRCLYSFSCSSEEYKGVKRYREDGFDLFIFITAQKYASPGAMRRSTEM